MEYQNIKEIVEVINWAEANEHLKLGWSLINIYNTVTDDVGPLANDLTPHYVLGWIGENPKYPPKEKKKETRLPGITYL